MAVFSVSWTVGQRGSMRQNEQIGSPPSSYTSDRAGHLGLRARLNSEPAARRRACIGLRRAGEAIEEGGRVPMTWQSDELKQFTSVDVRADTLVTRAVDLGVGRDTVNRVATDAVAASRLT
jgi:hypothetical protein